VSPRLNARALVQTTDARRLSAKRALLTMSSGLSTPVTARVILIMIRARAKLEKTASVCATISLGVRGFSRTWILAPRGSAVSLKVRALILRLGVYMIHAHHTTRMRLTTATPTHAPEPFPRGGRMMGTATLKVQPRRRIRDRVQAPPPGMETASATAMEVIKGTSTSMMAKAALVSRRASAIITGHLRARMRVSRAPTPSR
jgi:hypothetical protein